MKRNKPPTSGLDLVQRKQLERLYEIGKHRDAAAQTAMMLSCICLNHDHHFGMKRLLEHHARTKEMIDKFCEDPEQGCAWIKRELERIGFAESSLEEVMDALAVSDDLGKKLKRMEGKR